MSVAAWEAWTRIAIAILEVGSVAVFAWFLVDVVRRARAWRRGEDDRPGA